MRGAAGRRGVPKHDLRLATRSEPGQGALAGVEYRLEGAERAEPPYHLVTIVLEPERAPITELAGLYHERWEVEAALDEVKTHLRGARVVRRSKTPQLVKQQFRGRLLAHYANRNLMH